MNQQTVDMLTDMKLSAMAAEFTAQLQDPSFRTLSFEELQYGGNGRMEQAADKQSRTFD